MYVVRDVSILCFAILHHGIEVSTMRFFAFVLSLQTLSSSLYCNGFTYSAPKTSLQRAVDGMSNPSTALKSGVNEQEQSANKTPISIAATTALTLGLWAVSADPSLASPPIIPTAASSSIGSSFVVAAEYSSSDFTDFTMPSYQEALTSELNTNLKGGKRLFGEEASSQSSTR